MIVKNRLEVSTLIVYSFWYIALYLVFGAFRGDMPWWVVTDYPASLLVIAAGAGIGLMATLGVRAFTMHKRELSVSGGSIERGSVMSLGELMKVHESPRSTGETVAPYLALLHKRFWWKLVASEFPAHARALEAVMGVMAVEPLLPASPVPGGHAGRTLIEHSLAVADTILKQAKDWRYTGQRDKRGQLRVRLQGGASFQAFGRSDIGMIALAGFAHDIGKTVCYQRSGNPVAPWKTVPVIEVVPYHDVEGARLLRSIPEVMDLPYPDRRAVLLACGFYHHPGAIFISDAVTDRMRSLTELLIQADQATGRDEGMVISSQYDDDDDEEMDEADSSTNRTPVAESSGLDASTKGTDTKQVRAPTRAAVAMGDGERELELLREVLSHPSAIGARVEQSLARVGYKYAGMLWLSDDKVRGACRSLYGVTDAERSDMLSLDNGNAAPFTVRLLTALSQRGMLKQDFEDSILAPSRAQYIVKIIWGTRDKPKHDKPMSGVFMVPVSFAPSTADLPEDKPMKVVRPLWGRGSGKKLKAPEQSNADVGVAEAVEQEGAFELTSEDEGLELTTARSEPEALHGDGVSVQKLIAALVLAYPDLPRTDLAGWWYAKVAPGSEAHAAVRSMIEGLAAHGTDARAILQDGEEFLLPTGELVQAAAPAGAAAD